MDDIAAVLGPGGRLSRALAGYEHRPEQLTLAREVARAFDERRMLVAEAGTGTGKTLAYLVPAILSGRRVVVSTATKNLQDQLFHKDLPLVRDTLGLPVRATLVKGRATTSACTGWSGRRTGALLDSREDADAFAHAPPLGGADRDRRPRGADAPRGLLRLAPGLDHARGLPRDALPAARPRASSPGCASEAEESELVVVNHAPLLRRPGGAHRTRQRRGRAAARTRRSSSTRRTGSRTRRPSSSGPR